MKPPSPAPSTSTRAGSSQTDCRSDCRIAFGSTRRSTASSAAARDETRRSGLAVLSFDDPDGAQDPFAHGIVEEITCALSCSRDFHVIARQSAAALGDPSMDVAEAAARLGADYLVQGSVRRAGDHVRIAVRLVRGMTRTHSGLDASTTGSTTCSTFRTASPCRSPGRPRPMSAMPKSSGRARRRRRTVWPTISCFWPVPRSGRCAPTTIWKPNASSRWRWITPLIHSRRPAPRPGRKSEPGGYSRRPSCRINSAVS